MFFIRFFELDGQDLAKPHADISIMDCNNVEFIKPMVISLKVLGCCIFSYWQLNVGFLLGVCWGFDAINVIRNIVIEGV